jgi:uncharacterized protein YjiS (DUF1127 family)
MDAVVEAHADRAGETLRRVRERFARWRAARRTRAELAQLSDVELKDIGLARGDIDFVAAQLAA